MKVCYSPVLCTLFNLLILNHADNLCVKEFIIYEPLALQPGQNYALQLVATPSKQQVGEFSFEICSRLSNPEVSFSEPILFLNI